MSGLPDVTKMMANFPRLNPLVTLVAWASITPRFCNKIQLRDRCSKSHLRLNPP
jgi:hypothetical protein